VNITLNARLLLTGAAVSFLAGLLFGLVPALRVARATARFVRPSGLGAGRSRIGAGRALIAVQIAVSLPLIVGAALFLRTIHNFGRVELGFNPSGLVIFKLDPALNGYSRERVLAFYQQVLERVETVPGVSSATLAELALVSGWTSNSTISIDGAPLRRVQWNHVGPRFFETTGIRILAGRGLGLQDGSSAPRVAVVNESAARTLFGGQAIGRRFKLGSGASPEYEVVGLAQDGKYDSLRRDVSATLYLPYGHFARIGSMQVMVRAHAGPEIAGRLRAAVAQVDPDVPISGMKTQADQIDETISRERVFSVLLTLFGAFALLLACIGLHGVTAYAVARRTSEIGIRMALGAQRGSVLWLVLRQVVVLTLCGLVAGVPAAIAAARSVSSLLFGVAPGDPASVAAAALILCGVALISGLLPALRASRMDPLRALKVE
jgi:predicted permease